MLEHHFWYFRLSQIEDSIQYLQGTNSTWKDHDRNLGVHLKGGGTTSPPLTTSCPPCLGIHSKKKKYFRAPFLVLQVVTNRGLYSVPGRTMVGILGVQMDVC